MKKIKKSKNQRKKKRGLQGVPKMIVFEEMLQEIVQELRSKKKPKVALRPSGVLQVQFFSANLDSTMSPTLKKPKTKQNSSQNESTTPLASVQKKWLLVKEPRSLKHHCRLFHLAQVRTVMSSEKRYGNDSDGSQSSP